MTRATGAAQQPRRREVHEQIARARVDEHPRRTLDSLALDQPSSTIAVSLSNARTASMHLRGLIGAASIGGSNRADLSSNPVADTKIVYAGAASDQ